MKLSILPLVATTTLMTGCISLTVPGGFSPVQGPLAQQNPLPQYSAKMSGLLSGTISVILGTGEICQGQWAFVPTTPSGTGSTKTSTLEPVNMAADWDFVYGSGYYLAHVVGDKLYARATLTGNMGTIMHVELSNETNTRGNTKGVAVDNHANVFKVSVYN